MEMQKRKPLTMKIPLAWLNLVHEKTRLLVAIAGVAFAVILVFMNLGFLGALEKTASMIYDQMNAEIYLTSPQALELTSGKPFPIERIYQAAGIEGVEHTMPLYMGYLQWRNPETKASRAIFVYAFNPKDTVFRMSELQTPEHQAALRRPHTVLIDRFSRPEYGPRTTGLTTEAKRRQVIIGGEFALGGGFAADSTILMSDQNFRRYFDPFPLEKIHMGLIKLKDGTDPDLVAEKLRRILPKDVQVMTYAQIIERDRSYWINTTSTGFMFSLGVFIAFIVGIVIVYQILYTDISNHLRQYATLKAMGYRNHFLFILVIQEAIILAVLGFIPGFAISLGLYDLTLKATSGTLPISMTVDRLIFVLVLTLCMCVASALVSVKRAITADPANVF
jgi:putative ABC transport system permease protein